MSTPDGLPDYAPGLQAYHTAFEPELEAAIRRYELGPTARVLDSPCGDGFYAKLFARCMRSGTLIAADISPPFLEQAKRAVGAVSPELAVSFVESNAYALPFEDASFDLVWCAQSMISLRDPCAAIREMARVLKRGGQVAVLETDVYHHVLLPWPVNLELTIQKAIREACQKRYGSGAKYSQSRKLRREFREAGLTPAGKLTIAADRVAPFGAAEREFLFRYFQNLRSFIKPELTTRELQDFDGFTSETDAESFFNNSEAELTCLASVCHAVK